MSPRTLKTIVAILVVALAYLFFSAPGKVVVTPNGDITGIANGTRALLQGDRFWNNQLKVAEKELLDALNEPAQEAAFQREMRKWEQEDRQEEEAFYRKYPDLRPSPAERKARALRDAADRVEQAELDRMMEEHRLQRIGELRSVIRAIKSRQ